MEVIKIILKGMFFRGGDFSHTKLWSNVGYAVFTWAVIHKTLNASVSDELYLIYIGVVAAHTSFSRFLSNKQGDLK